MSGENGAERVKTYSTPIVDGLTFNYAAKAVDDNVLAILDKLAKEAQLVENMSHCTMAQLSIQERSVWFCIS